MSEHDDVSAGGTELQFDRVTRANESPADSRPAVHCTECRESIQTEYYDVNDRLVCDRCRRMIERFAEEPKGLGLLIRAGLFGFGAGIAGAAVYYAVLAIAHLEVGIIAILIGYLVGAAVRRGARGRGGLRLQIVAVALTYVSVAMAYLPIAIQGIAARQSAAATSRTGTPRAAPTTAVTPAAATPVGPPALRGFLVAFVLVLGFTLALPVLVVIGGFPLGLISALIIFIGMRQAWRMTGAPTILVLGPYRIGAATPA